MARTVSATVTTELNKTATSPGYLLSIPGIAAFPRLTSRTNSVVYAGNSYSGDSDFVVSGLSWDFSGAQKGRIELNDNQSFYFGTLVLANKLAGQPVYIYLYYAGAVTSGTIAASDLSGMFAGMIDACEITNNGRVVLNITSEFTSTLTSPRRYIKPGPVTTGFNWVPPAGTILVWGNETIKIERN